MTLVWENFSRGGSEKLAMLALADWCNDQGGSLHPSISGIAKKINVSESQARRIIHKFIDDGYLSVVANHDGGNPGQSRHYKMNVEMLLTPSTDATPRMDATPSTDARDPLHGCARPLAPMRETPSTHDTRTTINHHITTKEPSAQKCAEFELFWNAYPNKTGKQDALRKWLKIKPPLQKIFFALKWQKESQQWQQGYIPNPATYLNQHRWEDEPKMETVTPMSSRQMQASIAARSVFGNTNNEKCIDGEVIGYESTAKQLG